MKSFLNGPKSRASRRSFVKKQSATSTATKVASWLFAVVVAAVFQPSPAIAQGQTHQGSNEQVLKAYANLPLTFVENRGQTDARVRYYTQGPHYAFYLTDQEVMLSFDKGPGATGVSAGSKPGARGSLIPRSSPRSRRDRQAQMESPWHCGSWGATRGWLWRVRRAHLGMPTISGATNRRSGTRQCPATSRLSTASSGLGST